MAHVKHTMYVTNDLRWYNMILGRDMLQDLGINIDFKETSIAWEDYQAGMKSADVTQTEHLANIEATKAAAVDIPKILDAKYQMVDIQTAVVDS
eukprot:8827023-Ditylum_brightwellii.AAC.1